MVVYSSYADLPQQAQGASIALGNFDGVHAGHRAVLESARTAASTLSVPLGAAVFEPPPRRYFQPDAEPFRVMRPKARSEALAALGVDLVYELPFDTDMAEMSADGFIKTVLVDGLGIAHVSVGFDFHFGKGRAGNADTLRAAGQQYGFGVSVVGEVEDEGEKVSSTAIRHALTSGNPQKAKELLGGYWRVDGVVQPGEKRGRPVGFPTANLYLGDLIHPRHGVYTVWARIEGETGWYGGVANFGRTPTTGLRDPLLEVNLFDFDGDLYNRALDVAFVDFIRPEMKFDSFDALVAQIAADAETARGALQTADRPA